MNLSWDASRSVLSAIRIPSETADGILFSYLLVCRARSFSHPHSPDKPSPFQALLSPQVILFVLHCRWWSHRELFQPCSLFMLCPRCLRPVEDMFIHMTKASSPPCALPLNLLLLLSHWVVSDSFRPRGLSSARFLCPRGFPGKILAWVVISFSRGFSPPRDLTRVSCIGRRILYCLSHQGSPLLGYPHHRAPTSPLQSQPLCRWAQIHPRNPHLMSEIPGSSHPSFSLSYQSFWKGSLLVY